MNYFFVLPFILIALSSVGQTAEELNEDSKLFLAKEDYKSAFPIIQSAAKLGSLEAKYNLGVCYQYGFGVEKNDSIATSWYLKSADEGWLDGQYKMSYAYTRGNGIEQNAELAFKYALLCAQQNDIECIFNVINCYKEGNGAPKDSLKVEEWAMVLGRMENPENLHMSGQITSARLNLALMYLNGNGVKQSDFNSYVWFLIYNESKRDFATMLQEKQIETIKTLEKKLSKKEKTNAVTQAEELLGEKLRNLDFLYVSGKN